MTKILKTDENNQYGNAKTKPLPTGSIKKMKKSPSFWEFNLLIESILDKDKISHLFFVNIQFNEKNASKKTSLFNKMYTSIFEKKKVILVVDWSVFQLLDAMTLNDKNILNSYKATRSHIETCKKGFTFHYIPNIYTFS